MCIYKYIATDFVMYIYIHMILDMYRYRAQGLKYTFLQGGMNLHI